LTSAASPWLQEHRCWARIYCAISARSETDALLTDDRSTHYRRNDYLSD